MSTEVARIPAYTVWNVFMAKYH